LIARTITSEVIEVPELVMNALVPSTHSPASSRAVVRMPPGISDPPGSVRPKAASRSPAHSSGSQRWHCSLVPDR
jgi:hypothetical protein